MSGHQVEVVIALGNIKSNPIMPPGHVEDDMAALRSLLGSPTYGAVFGAEIIKAHGYMAQWVEAMSGLHTYGRGVECPVSTTHGVRVSHAAAKRLTIGVAKVSPNRYRVTVKAHAGGLKVAYIASHNVNGAKAPVKYRTTIGVRRVLFTTWRRKMRRHIKRLIAAGFTVIVGGDFNSPGQVRLHPDQVAVLNKGLMQLAVIPAAGVRVVAMSHSTKTGHTDHPLCRARITFQID